MSTRPPRPSSYEPGPPPGWSEPSAPTGWEPPPPVPPRGGAVALGIVIGVLLGNVIAWSGHLALGPRSATGEAAVEAQADDALSRAHRLAGLDALEAGHYPAAVKDFAAALRAPNPAPDLTRLLAIAQTMVERAKEVVARPDAAPSPEDRPGDQAPPARVEPEAPKGLLLVTTTPAKLTIRIDGEPRDLSPARIELTPGRHELVILDGRRPIFGRQIRVKPGQVVAVNQDLSSKVLPPEPDSAEGASDPVQEAAAAAPGAPESADTASTADGDLDEAAAESDEEGEEPATAEGADPSEGDGDASGDDDDDDDDDDVTTAVSPDPATSTPPIPTPAPEPDPPAPLDPAPSVPDELSPDDIRQAFLPLLSRLQACYDRELARRPNLRGLVRMRILVRGDGGVEDAKVTSSELGSSRARYCIDRALDGLRFPESAQPGIRTARYTILFKPPE